MPRYSIRGGRASGLRLVVLVAHHGLHPSGCLRLLAVLRAVVGGRVRVVGWLVRDPVAVRLAPVAMLPGGGSRGWQQRQNLFLAGLLACGWDACEPDLAVEVTVSLFLFFWLFPPDLGFPDCQDWGRRKVIVSCMILLSHLALMALMPSRSLWKVGSISKPSWNTLMMNLTTLIGSNSVVAEETLCLRTQACTCCRMWSRFAAEFVAWPKRDESCKCHHFWGGHALSICHGSPGHLSVQRAGHRLAS